MNAKYFESHITIEPVFGVALDRVKALAERHGFKVADLLMQKRVGPERLGLARSIYDTFCTGRGKDFEELRLRMTALASDLDCSGFKVWREKIEAVIVDVRHRAAA